MEPENKALALVVLGVAVVLVIGAVGVHYFATPLILPSSLPIPAGTVFSGNATETWTAHFNVSVFGSRVVGTWTAFDGIGFPYLVVVNGTVAKPSGVFYSCALARYWSQSNGTVDTPVGLGAHTIYWAPCFGASRIVVTERIQAVGVGLLW
jgi:hypothetical protein